ncbi:hypothetical protein BUUB107078_08895 [Burkholderia ubonensis]
MNAGMLSPLHDTMNNHRFSSFQFCIWLAFGALIYFSDQLDRSLNLSFFLIPVLFIPAAIIGIIWLISFGRCVWNGQWRTLASVILAPVLTFAFFGTLLKFKIDPDWIHFQVVRTDYLREIRESPGQSPKHHRWYWGDTGSAIGPNIFHTLIYDEADDPLRGQTMAEEQDDSTDVRPMGDHFFLVTQYR